MTHNNTLEYNEHHQNITPGVNEQKLDRYENTIYYEPYTKGLMGGKMTLDQKNREKIIQNLIKIILDDIHSNNKSNLDGQFIVKSCQKFFDITFDLLKSEKINIDVKRIGAIIEGYGKYIEQKNN